MSLNVNISKNGQPIAQVLSFPSLFKIMAYLNIQNIRIL